MVSESSLFITQGLLFTYLAGALNSKYLVLPRSPSGWCINPKNLNQDNWSLLSAEAYWPIEHPLYLVACSRNNLRISKLSFRECCSICRLQIKKVSYSLSPDLKAPRIAMGSLSMVFHSLDKPSGRVDTKRFFINCSVCRRSLSEPNNHSPFDFSQGFSRIYQISLSRISLCCSDVIVLQSRKKFIAQGAILFQSQEVIHQSMGRYLAFFLDKFPRGLIANFIGNSRGPELSIEPGT